MKIAVTGADGFLGKHLRTRLRADGRHQVAPLGRAAFNDDSALASALGAADVVVHLAGVNRGPSQSVEGGNLNLAERLIDALETVDGSPVIIFANSIQAGENSPYGRGKKRAASALLTWAEKRSIGFVDILYKNIFGEGGRPGYNSFVATFCHGLADGRLPEIHVDRSVELIHAQDAVETITRQFGRLGGPVRLETHGTATSVGEVASRLEAIAATYATGSLPDLADPFTLQLFNTYRSYVPPSFYPYPLTVRSDARGGFVETVRSSGGQSQVSFSTTAPGVTRGNHFHLRKVERFAVLKGRARIAIRHVCGSRVDVFDVSGDSPSFVDMPTLATHNITNVGQDTLYTLFWTNEIFDPDHPDTYMDAVE